MSGAAPPHLIILLGSSPTNEGELDPAAKARVNHIINLRKQGGYFAVVCMGRRSNPKWNESEAACMCRHLLADCKALGKPMHENLVRIDDRPKSTSESLQLIPEWEAWFTGHGIRPHHILVVSNAAYEAQYEVLREGQGLNAKVKASLTFEAAPDFAMTSADHKRLKHSLWKARIDPFDRWINQWRISRQPKPVKFMLRAADAALTVMLTLVRALGVKPKPGPFPPRKLDPDGSIG